MALRRPHGCRFAIVVSRFNEEITDGLLSGARDGARRGRRRAMTTSRSFTCPAPSRFRSPRSGWPRAGRFDAIVCLGCLIKGDTMHFEYIAEAASHGIMQAAAATGVPMAFGVLTTLTEEQAVGACAPTVRATRGGKRRRRPSRWPRCSASLDDGIGA